MPAFEPSTWAEVTEAAATLRAPDEHPFVTRIRAFTESPEKFSTHFPGENLSIPEPADSPPRARTKRSDGQFDDLLGYGRVDQETESFVRRHASTSDDVVLPSCGEGVINPSSVEFDAGRYLASVHVDSTREQLKEGKAVLATVRKRLETEVEMFRKEKFVSAALVEAAFESTKISLLPLSPFDEDGSGKETELIFEGAEAMLKKRYEDVMQRETRLARLQRTLAVFQRYEWVFKLGERMRAAATEDVASIEEAMKEYGRGMKWLEAQDGGHMTVIQDDVDDGFRVLIEAIVARLSNAHCMRSAASRLVTVLSSVRKEGLLSDVLAKRMTFAEDGLQKALRSMDVTHIGVGEGRISEHETSVLVTRISNAFYEGLSHVWRLGRVLMSHDRWLRIVDGHIVHLCEEYAKIVKDTLLGDVSVISQTAVKEVASAHMKAVSELMIPEACLGPLEEVSSEIIECFVTSLSKAVRGGAEEIALQSTKNDVVGVQAAQLLQALVLEGLAQVDSSLFRGKEGLDEKSVNSKSKNEDEGSMKFDQSLSTVDVLGQTCAEAPGLFAEYVYKYMQESNGDTDLASLKVAVCCTELMTNVMKKISEVIQAGSAYDTRLLQKELQESGEKLGKIKEKALNSYVTLVSRPLQRLARSLVSFPEDDMVDSVSRTIPIKIEGVSKCANELVLQLALIMITTRKRSSHAGLIRHILLHVISEIGRTLVSVLSTDKLAYHRAAQLWVDVTYMQEMVTKGARAESRGVQDSVDGFSRVKERAVQAVLADGYSFSLADMQMLKESVVAGGMEESCMLCECFAESWELFQDEDVNSSDD